MISHVDTSQAGAHTTPRRRAAIIAYRLLPVPLSYRKIESITRVPSSTANRIFERAIKKVQQKHADILLRTLEDEMQHLHLFQHVLPLV